MGMRAARANETRSRLLAALQQQLHAEWWYAVESDVGGDQRRWPGHVIEAFLLAEMEWRQQVGRIDVRARTYACVPNDAGKLHCVLMITYARVRQEPNPAPSGRETAGGSEQVDAAAPARSFSPSLCGAGIGGWGRH